MKAVLSLIAICIILFGCSNSYYTKILLAENSQNKWSTKTSPKEKVWNTLNYCDENKCNLKAVFYATSGFHFENYAVFEINRIIVTIAYGDSVTQKGQTRYNDADLAWTYQKNTYPSAVLENVHCVST